jgi:hypothetical protein
VGAWLGRVMDGWVSAIAEAAPGSGRTGSTAAACPARLPAPCRCALLLYWCTQCGPPSAAPALAGPRHPLPPAAGMLCGWTLTSPLASAATAPPLAMTAWRGRRSFQSARWSCGASANSRTLHSQWCLARTIALATRRHALPRLYALNPILGQLYYSPCPLIL